MHQRWETLKLNKGAQLQVKMVIKTLHHLLLACLALLLIVSCTAPRTTSPPPNGGELATYQMEIDLLGTKHEASVNSQGRLKTSTQVASADGTISLSIDRDTVLLYKDGKPLQFIQATIGPTPPLPPEEAYIVGVVYDLRPTGATFTPPLKLTLSYNPDKLPQGLREGDVYIACYEGSKWEMVRYKQVDTERHRIATRIDYFSRFAVLAPMAPASPRPTSKPSPGLDLASIPLQQALSSGKPTLAEFGWRTCIPCKQMKPILEELAVEYEGKLNVVIVEVYEQKALTQQYGIMAIPTQIFFDSSGKELKRHMGFWPKEEIIVQLKKMGID